jgi:hypothetical protein
MSDWRGAVWWLLVVGLVVLLLSALFLSGVVAVT